MNHPSRSHGQQYPGVEPTHVHLLEATLRAPSAHNAQPWKIHPVGDGRTYEFHYRRSEDLPFDERGKDAYLTMGAMIETMVLAAPNFGQRATVVPELAEDGPDLFIARVAIDPAEPNDPVDPLSAWVARRVTNRNKYDRTPLPEELIVKLKALGNVVLGSEMLATAVEEASIEGWGDRQFVRDLQTWLREDSHAKDGLTAAAMNLSSVEMQILRVAFRAGRVATRTLRKIFSSSEVAAFRSAPNAAVISVDELTPQAMFDAGRRLLRSWVEITAAGFSYQPYSIAVDQPSTIPTVAALANQRQPVALYRIGHAKYPPKVRSNRRPLSEVLF